MSLLRNIRHHHITAIFISAVILVALYWGKNDPIMLCLSDVLWMAISFTIPMMLVENWQDVLRRKYWIVGISFFGLVLFTSIIPYTDPKYNAETDRLLPMISTDIMGLMIFIGLQLGMNALLRTLARE